MLNVFNKALIKYGLIVFMLTLAVILYFGPKMEEMQIFTPKVKFEVAGHGLAKFKAEEMEKFSAETVKVVDPKTGKILKYKGTNLKAIIDQLGVKNYKTITIASKDGSKQKIDSAKGTDTYIVYKCNGKELVSDDKPVSGPFGVVMHQGKDNQVIYGNVKTIECR